MIYTFKRINRKIYPLFFIYLLLFNAFFVKVFTQTSEINTHYPSDYAYYNNIAKEYFTEIQQTRNNQEKIRINIELKDTLRNFLLNQEKPTPLLDSVEGIGIISSKQNRLKIYTWNLPQMDGTHIYYGFIHYYSKELKKSFLYELSDSSGVIINPEYVALNYQKWFGALYYELIEEDFNGLTYYTLLGYDPNNLFTSKKLVDILTITGDSIPIFGSPIIHYNQYVKSRVIFEYSSKTTMGLHYNKELKMIVFDHLSPSKPSLKDKYQFYGPDFSYDGLKFEKGRWIYYPDIDARNRFQ